MKPIHNTDMKEYSMHYNALGDVTFCSPKSNDNSLAQAVELWCNTKGFNYQEKRTSLTPDVMFIDVHVFGQLESKNVEHHLQLIGWQKV